MIQLEPPTACPYGMAVHPARCCQNGWTLPLRSQFSRSGTLAERHS